MIGISGGSDGSERWFPPFPPRASFGEAGYPVRWRVQHMTEDGEGMTHMMTRRGRRPMPPKVGDVVRFGTLAVQVDSVHWDIPTGRYAVGAKVHDLPPWKCTADEIEAMLVEAGFLVDVEYHEFLELLEDDTVEAAEYADLLRLRDERLAAKGFKPARPEGKFGVPYRFYLEIDEDLEIGESVYTTPIASLALDTHAPAVLGQGGTVAADLQTGMLFNVTDATWNPKADRYDATLVPKRLTVDCEELEDILKQSGFVDVPRRSAGQ